MKKKVFGFFLTLGMVLAGSAGVSAETAENVTVAEDDDSGIQAALQQFDGGSISMNLETGDMTFYSDEDNTAEEGITENSLPDELEKIEILNDEESEEMTRLFIGEDDRIVLDQDTLQNFPFTSIVQITTTFSDGTIYSTSGAMISPYTVLTNASNLVDPTKGYWPIDVTVAAAPYGEVHPFGNVGEDGLVIKEEFYESTYASTDDNWYSHAAYDSDLALIILEEDLGSQTGYMGVGCAFNMAAGDEAAMVGYDNEAQTLVTSWGSLVEVKDTYIGYDIDINDSQSGAPIIMKDSDDEEFIAAVAFGESDSLNYAVRVNLAVYNWILAYAK